LLTRAKSAGFDFVADLSATYKNQSTDSLALSPGDYHPNIRGHKQLAEAWERHLAAWPALVEKLNESLVAP
ncbi:MAG: hypothetical protein ACKO5E_14985, partial [bacterium]